MGTYQNPNRGKKFYNLHEGQIVLEVIERTPGAVMRINKKDREVWELRHDGIVGYITGISTRDTDYGKQWQIEMADEAEAFTINMSYSSGYAQRFLRRIEGIDFNKEVKIEPYFIEGDDKVFRAYIGIFQDGQKLPDHYTKENNYNGLPEMEQVEVNGQPQWDSSKRMIFLEDLVNRIAKPRIIEANSVVGARPEIAQGEQGQESQSEEPISETAGQAAEQAPAADAGAQESPQTRTTEPAPAPEGAAVAPQPDPAVSVAPAAQPAAAPQTGDDMDDLPF